MLLTLKEKPLAQKRARFVMKGKFPSVYDPQSSEKKKIKMLFVCQMRSKGYLIVSKGPISINVTFHIPTPKKWSKKLLKAVLEKQTFVCTKPDADNYLKFIFDVLNGIAYKDDSQIAEIYCKKIYSADPKTEIHIEKIED